MPVSLFAQLCFGNMFENGTTFALKSSQALTMPPPIMAKSMLLHLAEILSLMDSFSKANERHWNHSTEATPMPGLTFIALAPLPHYRYGLEASEDGKG